MPEIPEPPFNRAAKLQGQGRSNRDIAETLQGEGLTAQETSEALNQAELRGGGNLDLPQSAEMEPSAITGAGELSEAQLTPQEGYGNVPQAVGGSIGREAEEFIEEVAESIITEKWERVNEEFGDLAAWKDRVNTDLIAIKQEILRIENRVDNLQNTIVGRLGEYDTHISGVGTEVRALEEVLKKMMKPLSTNIKELSRVTEDLKKTKKSK